MLSKRQINWIVDKVNEKVDVPILGERAEAWLIRKGIMKILKVLAKYLPEEIFDFLDDVSDGIEPGMDLEEIKANTVVFLNKEINLPIVGENFEEALFTEVIDIIFEALKKGNRIGKV